MRRCHIGGYALVIVLMGAGAAFSVDTKELSETPSIEIFSSGKRFKSVAEYKRYQHQEKKFIIPNDSRQPSQDGQAKDIFFGGKDIEYLPQMQEMLREYLKDQGESPSSFSFDAENMKTIIFDSPKRQGEVDGQSYPSILWSLSAPSRNRGMQGVEIQRFLKYFHRRSKNPVFLSKAWVGVKGESKGWPAFSFIFDLEQIKILSHFLRNESELKKFSAIVNAVKSFQYKIFKEEYPDTVSIILGRSFKQLEPRRLQTPAVDSVKEDSSLSVVGLNQEEGLPPIIIDRHLLPADYFKEEVDTN